MGSWVAGQAMPCPSGAVEPATAPQPPPGTSNNHHLWQAIQELQSTITTLQGEPDLRRRYGNTAPQWDRSGPRSPLSSDIL